MDDPMTSEELEEFCDSAPERKGGPLWELLDWTFWGAGMADTFREPLTDVMLAAVPDNVREQAEAIMAEFLRVRKIDKTGVTIYQGQRAELEEARNSNRDLVRLVGQLSALIEAAFADGAADPIGALQALCNYLAEELILDSDDHDRANHALEDQRRAYAALRAQRDAVLALIGEAHSLAAADIQAGGPSDQLDDLSIPVHDLLVALGVLDEDGAKQGTGDQERRDLVAATIATAMASRMVICEHTQVIEYGSCANAVLTALARRDGAEAERTRAELATAKRLLSEGLSLRMHGEDAPGCSDTWRAWDTRTEEWLRRDERLDEAEADRG